MTVCQNCGARQGPFDRDSVGTKNMPIILIGCARGAIGGSIDKPFWVGTRACLERRAVLDRKRYPQAAA